MFVLYNTRVSKRILSRAVESNAVRELAFIIAIKRKTSTVKGKTLSQIHNTLGEIAGCSSSTARRYVDTIGRMGGITLRKKNGYIYAEFGKIRAPKIQSKKNGKWWSPRHSDVVLFDGNTTFTNYKDIELALRAQYIVERQSTRDFFTQTMKIAGNPDNGTSAKEIRSARKRLHRYGIKNFSDKGMSNRYLRNKLHCGTSKLAEAIAYGETIGLFSRTMPSIKYIRVGRGMGETAFESSSEFTFYTYSYVALSDGATRYRLIV